MREATPATLERTYRGAVALLTVLAFLLSAAWAIMLPLFDGPDESRHYNSVARIVNGDGWGRPYEPRLLGSTQQALVESGVGLPDGSRTAPAVVSADRSGFLDPGSFEPRFRDYMVQHPPGYYVVQAGVITVAGGESLRWDRAHLLMRIASAAMLAAAVPFMIGAARWATGSRVAGIVGAAAVLAIPFFTVMGSYVSNDTLLLTTCSATLYFLVRACSDSRLSAWMLPLAGIAYGGALLTKGLALMLAPAVVVLAILAAHRRGWSVKTVATQIAAPAVIAAAIGGWWWVRNYLVLGVVQPSQFGSRERLQEPVAEYDLGRFVSGFFDRFNATFWGRGASAEKAFPQALEWGLAAVALGVVVSALIWGRRRWLMLVLLSFPVIVACTLFFNAHGIYWDTGRPQRGIQGRYVFSGAAAFAVVAAIAWCAAVRRLRRSAGTLLALVAPLPFLVTLLAMSWLVPRSWSGLTGLEAGWLPDEYMGVPKLIYIALLGITALVVVCLSATLVRLHRVDAELVDSLEKAEGER
ncbi:MAG: glycosyltransferase family 39 protein [Actinomycetota bacterium]